MSFMMGTHPSAGQDSPVWAMRGSVYAVRAITDLFNIKSFKKKITDLIQQVNTLLKTVHKHSPLIIPHLLHEPLPEKPEFTDGHEFLPEEEQDKILNKLGDIEGAEWAHEYYGCGWNQHQYRCVLTDFLREGTVQRNWMVPNRGFQQANYDVDQSAGFQACNRYSFRCLMTPDSESLEHVCNTDQFKDVIKQALKKSKAKLQNMRI